MDARRLGRQKRLELGGVRLLQNEQKPRRCAIPLANSSESALILVVKALCIMFPDSSGIV